MNHATTDPTDGYAVDRFREECHVDGEGYLHTGTSSGHVDTIIIQTDEQRR
ncbi:hypothetical protein ACERIM_07360 [Natrinema sp. H-ect1]|uniref:hypothetical protein n=1 Tax=Natrinema sp. H-ect1 TaxID=3242700 RepID=UPI00359D34B8